MADLRSKTHGEGALEDVNLVVMAYDKRVARNKETGEISTHYLDARIHPGDRRGPGETNLALVSKKDEKSPTGYNNSARYSAGQFAAIQKAAGDNVADLTLKDGEVVGKIYGVKANLLINNGEVIINTKTLAATKLSVQPNAEGDDIRKQIFDSMAKATAAREAAKAAQAEAPATEATTEAAADVSVEEPPAEQEADLVGALASSDEPGLG